MHMHIMVHCKLQGEIIIRKIKAKCCRDSAVWSNLGKNLQIPRPQNADLANHTFFIVFPLPFFDSNCSIVVSAELVMLAHAVVLYQIGTQKLLVPR